MFEKCYNCNHSGIDCIQHVMSLPIADLHEWCKVRQKALGLTNAIIAKRANLPKGTVDRFLSPGYSDAKYSTVYPVVLVLAGLSAEIISCDSDRNTDKHMVEQIERQEETIRQLGIDERRRIDFLKEQLHISQEAYKKVRKVALTLAFLIGLTLALIIAALVIDRLDPDIGFFWRTAFGLTENGGNAIHKIFNWGI